MRRFASICFLATACYTAQALTLVPARGDNRLRVSAFRELTNENPTQASYDPAETPLTVSEPVEIPPTTSAPPSSAAMPQMVMPPSVATMPTHVPSTGAAMRRPVSLYSGPSARAALTQFPRRAPAQTNPGRPARRQSKPFQGYRYDHEPTLSPYLNLDRDDDEQTVPNYFTFVRPEIQQRETNRMQERELQQMRGQIQTMTSSGTPSQFEMGRSTGNASPARFMDTAQFYGGSR